MACEFVYNEAQTVALNSPVLFNDSIPCNKGYVVHNNGDGVVILRGITNQCYATYQVVYNGNIQIPTGGAVAPIAVAITVNGEPRATSKAVFTPAAVEEYGNVTSTAIIKVPRGCCFSVAVENIPAVADDTTPSIEVANSNLVISRIG